MFRKTKAELKPPQPPTFASILEDMETFLVEKPPIEKVRTLPSASENAEVNSNSNRNNLEDWWKVFETFYSDNEDLQNVRRRLNASQKLLEDQKKEITEKTDEIQQDIDLALRDPPIDLG
ncbi:uncharacterized protein LOC119066948 [Bradysia coprophila]|uniref:uncharacterized protein LOC119066948 n=1 Tax=Bradysia coprophila TaxID=38358 RepID=UPI00187DBEB2|nr:uncharacterized protein LOC119066948 [Bradysia coprophila]